MGSFEEKTQTDNKVRKKQKHTDKKWWEREKNRKP